ncbi:MAG: aldehyde dehydrogenase [Pseudomonas sp. BICA1-14]|jgi:aldehyde dehydrogenase (NAD+)|uniref:aldehyde dehydrogenase family protein n=1 Tax=Stutzerimonas kunmingensis TaxID=1211807 RepID=UPI0005B448EC|nr:MULTISPECIES: aldehyde dehydrogenase family protein [Stutzerimonas stutzeri group]KJS64937.1 MAG: aldehyde dehydrogenase [[Pseudomonas] sp. BICA1-14]PKM03106.1 MAG: aldehyde dehydrogenase [Gammaproteobacteria bacterium HGW-Gammaproteobacteria-6]
MSIPFTQLNKLYIDGAWVSANGPTEAVLNPATEEVIGQAPVGDTASADAAIDAARRAFDSGPWPWLSMAERAGYMRRMHSALVAHREEIAALIIAEVGCAQGVTYAMQVDMPLAHVLKAIDQSLHDATQQIPVEATPNPFNPGGPMILGSGSIEREPIGVVSGITGYNFPFLLNLAKIFPALLAGNTLVLKPSPFTPYSALLFGEIAEQIGLPKGVLNIVTGGVEVGSLLSSDPRVDMVSFTGSEAVGASIMSQAAPTLKRVHLELGGKSALIVRPDADIQGTALGAIAGLTVNAGQGCALLTRFLVHNSIREQFVQMAKAVASQMKIGNPADPSVVMGPLIRESQRAKVEHFVASGRDSGATLVCGGGRPQGLDKGFFSDITLFDDVRNDITIAQEEIFGPVGVVIGFDSDEEAIAIANDSRYGLNGAVATADAAVAYQMARRIRAGSVYINGGGGKMPYAPIGGFKRSGIGREFGPDWLKEFTQEKSIIYPIGR